MLEAAAGGAGGVAAAREERGRRAADVRLRLPRLGGVLGPEHARPVPVVEGRRHAEPPRSIPPPPYAAARPDLQTHDDELPAAVAREFYHNYCCLCAWNQQLARGSVC
jgi:hypothetical protein